MFSNYKNYKGSKIEKDYKVARIPALQASVEGCV
jgi:hypothetical protein